MPMKTDLFAERHIAVTDSDVAKMLDSLNLTSLDELVAEAVPQNILLSKDLNLPSAASEGQALAELEQIFAQNELKKSFLGQGYYGTYVPAVIKRNFFENPAWYTSYTPYQAEISQGRLELAFHFQTLVSELTGLPIAAASLLDEATAAAEAAMIAVRHHRNKRKKVLLVNKVHPQIEDVIITRAKNQEVEVISLENAASLDQAALEEFAAILIAWPDTYGVYHDYSSLIAQAKAAKALIIATCDPLAQILLEAPATWGADIAVGSLQRFGVPLGFGGPHAGFLAVTTELTRLLPGRIVGQSQDAAKNPAYRLALQTREQHIRRDKATSNICTAQALLANMAAAYAIWHGATGLREIAQKVHGLASSFAAKLLANGFNLLGTSLFDTVAFSVKGKAVSIAEAAAEAGYLLRVVDEDRLVVSFDEISTASDIDTILSFVGAKTAVEFDAGLVSLPDNRTGRFLSQAVFNQIKSETEMMRFLRRLSDKDLSLDRAMIPLGSCTMKLNAAAELMPVSWEKVANIHPFAPTKYVAGYLQMIKQLENWLSEITGFAAVSLQPNSGAQGEFAGLIAIRSYLEAKGEGNRNICLIPASAHGTNPASAHMAGLDVIVVNCLENGNIDIVDLQAKAEKYADKIAALMITYPSTYGVYEEEIRSICDIIHQIGGQVYFDGANLNALVGLARPCDIGADVCHMNLHKTFAIPHGGGGPGVGPIGVAKHLVEFLPGHVACGTEGAVAAAPYGSASILVISWMYIRMMGAAGLKKATQIAILNANYIAQRLNAAYPALYKGARGRVAHECIIDTRPLKSEMGITVDDIAKRLIDYGFHAPTMSFPVVGTLMIEPTESEPKSEIDRLCDALLAIAQEAQAVKDGIWSADDNPLVNAPHTLQEVTASQWEHAYSREIAAFPTANSDYTSKYWSPVARIDNVYGDRNLICSCPPLESDIVE